MNIMQKARSLQQIRKNKEELRKNLRNKLKLPVIKKEYTPQTNTVSTGHPEPKFDKRLFENVFELLEKIGQGAHGVVHKCREIRTNKLFAVKITKGDAQLMMLTKRTFKILQMFDDNRIVKGKLLLLNEQTEQIHLVMEYCPFPSLRTLIKSTKLDYDRSRQIIQKLLESVVLVHDHLVCHRDLKPDNILYDLQRSQIKLIDFGISKRFYNIRKANSQQMWTITGTMQYKAPEMMDGSAYNQKVDAWAIGIITYELIYGRMPFYSEYLSDLVEMIQKAEPEFPQLPDKQQSAIVTDFIKALLRKNPVQRLSCKQALKHFWVRKRQRFPLDDMSVSMVISGGIKNLTPQLQYSHSPANLAQSDLLSEPQIQKKEKESKKFSWTNIPEHQIIEVSSNVNEKQWQLCKSTESIHSFEQIQKQIETAITQQFMVFDMRSRSQSRAE